MSRYRGETDEAEFLRVASLHEIPAGRMICVEVDGREVALVNLQGTLYAIDNNCPHNGGPLAKGRLDSNSGEVTCPWHAWSLDVRSGKVVAPPVGYRALTYDVRVEGDVVLIRRSPR